MAFFLQYNHGIYSGPIGGQKQNEQRNTYGMEQFFPKLAVEEMTNYELLLGHSHFAYADPLSNHTSSTAKLGKKRIHPVF